MLSRYSPILIMFILGMGLKKVPNFPANFGKHVLKWVFYVTLPAFIIDNLNKVNLSIGDLQLLAAVVPVFLVGGLLATPLANRLTSNRHQKGPIILSVMIMNLGFIFPFVYLAYGVRGTSALILINAGNGILTIIIGYLIAVRYGPNWPDKKSMVRQLIKASPIYALLMALIFQLWHVHFNGVPAEILHVLGVSGLPLVVLALGNLFKLKAVNYALVLPPVFLRVGVGLFFMAVISFIYNGSMIIEKVLYLAVLAPCGFNTVTFSVIEKLDTTLAADIVSLSTLLSFLYIPFVL